VVVEVGWTMTALDDMLDTKTFEDCGCPGCVDACADRAPAKVELAAMRSLIDRLALALEVASVRGNQCGAFADDSPFAKIVNDLLAETRQKVNAIQDKSHDT